ncbi:amphi-Trp domain-containing protein [Yinghuangia soli]|uniref:Amphi-Trp domain-containing protein n=1 Tax=Yinghuangia soli TaxID=2908204 RepID=A0AA41U8Q7_9ACTN|nr:amphi-Trp domain-containing protein [Yinghuangia soli]MCF2533144.1 amphi-Trp domain-containing protein [Yinghuangia soli]
MADLKFEQKRPMSRLEAADQLMAFAEALREGGETDVDLGSGTLSLRIPDDLRSEIEIEVGDGEIELEIEFKWPIRRTPAAPSPTPSSTKETPARRKRTPAKPERSTPGTGRKTNTKRSATRKS